MIIPESTIDSDPQTSAILAVGEAALVEELPGAVPIPNVDALLREVVGVRVSLHEPEQLLDHASGAAHTITCTLCWAPLRRPRWHHFAANIAPTFVEAGPDSLEFGPKFIDSVKSLANVCWQRLRGVCALRSNSLVSRFNQICLVELLAQVWSISADVWSSAAQVWPTLVRAWPNFRGPNVSYACKFGGIPAKVLVFDEVRPNSRKKRSTLVNSGQCWSNSARFARIRPNLVEIGQA